MNAFTLRMVEENDAESLMKIYKPYVENTAITFECSLPGPDAFKTRVRNVRSMFPCIAAVKDGRIIGYAYASKHKERAAYGWNAELSIYLDMDFRGGGIGTALYSALIDILKLQNIQTVYASVSSENNKSHGLHKKLGFTEIGVLKNTGFKLGKWLDMILLQKSIGSYDNPPAPFKNINDISKDDIEKILKLYS